MNLHYSFVIHLRETYIRIYYIHIPCCVAGEFLQGLSFITFLNILELSAVEDGSDVIETHCYQ